GGKRARDDRTGADLLAARACRECVTDSGAAHEADRQYIRGAEGRPLNELGEIEQVSGAKVILANGVGNLRVQKTAPPRERENQAGVRSPKSGAGWRPMALFVGHLKAPSDLPQKRAGHLGE